MAKDVRLDTGAVDQTVPAGLKWLYEMEAVHSPALLNNLYGNIYSYPGVSDTEILIDRFNRKMLIYIKFTWFTRKILKYRRKEATISILDQLQELLPSFEFRIIEDKPLFDLAVRRMHEKLFGGGKDVTPESKPFVQSENAASAGITTSVTVPGSANAVSSGGNETSADPVKPAAGDSDSGKPSGS